MHVLGPDPTTDFDGQLQVEGTATTGAIDTGAGIEFLGHDGNIRRNWGGIRVLKASGIMGNTASNMIFTTRSAGALPVERMRIDFGGKVGIGRTPIIHKLEVEGNACKTVGGSTWASCSDRRIKKNIKTIDGALNKLDELRVTSFEYTDEYKAAHPDAEDRRYMNVIAQEFAEVFPDHVSSMSGLLPGKGDLLIVDTYPLTIYSVAAIQELREIVKEKDAEITALQARMTALEQSIGKVAPSPRAGTLGMATPALAALCLVGFVALNRGRKGGAQ